MGKRAERQRVQRQPLPFWLITWKGLYWRGNIWAKSSSKCVRKSRELQGMIYAAEFTGPEAKYADVFSKQFCMPGGEKQGWGQKGEQRSHHRGSQGHCTEWLFPGGDRNMLEDSEWRSGVLCSRVVWDHYGGCVNRWRETCGDAVSTGEAQRAVQRPLQQPRWQMACSGASGGVAK